MGRPAKERIAVSETQSIYQIFTRNFTEEGTFRAAVGRLDEVRDLGIDWVYLTPVHPIGKAARKGRLGSPYAVADYRSLNGELGSLDDFRAFVDAVHERGMKVMIDVVFNHTSPDSALAAARPEWFLRGADGKLARKCEDWTDVVDLDFSSSHELWDELIDTLTFWRGQGIEGFRCDVASLVPADFWKEARRRVSEEDPVTGEERRPTLWLAESVHPSFLLSMRDRGYGAWSDGELHQAFDLSYDYDGWERLERVWAGRASLASYLEHLEIQRALSPASARKIRYLENHDQRRAALRFGRGPRLEAWTAFYQLLPGATFVYMGQEYGMEETPSLFEKEPVRWEEGDAGFRSFFASCLSITRRVKGEAPSFSWKLLGEGVVLLERSGARSAFSALLNLDDRSGSLELPEEIVGRDLFTGREVRLAGSIELPRGALVIEREASAPA